MRNEAVIRWSTLVITVIAIIGAFIGSGLLGGTPVQDAAGGWLSSTATPVAPAGPAFRIWTVIYLGFACYAVWQLGESGPRLDRVRWLIAASALLNALWIGAVQLGWLGASLVIITVLLAVLVSIVTRLTGEPDSGWELVFVDITIGLYLGWITVATMANLTAWLWSWGYRGAPFGENGFAILVLLTALAIALMTVIYQRRMAPALASSWALMWISVARWEGYSAVAITALIGCLLLLAVAVVWKLREPPPAADGGQPVRNQTV